MGRPEALNEDYLVEQAERYNILCRKLQWVGRNGAPDRFLACNGKIVLAEMKSKTGTLSAIQKIEIAKLKAQGIPVKTLNNKKAIDKVINWLVE